MAVTVLVADDDESFRNVLKRVLGQTVEVIGEAPRGEAAVALARKHRPDVVLMSIDIAGLDGIAATREIKAAAPGIKVILLTAHQEEAYLSATGKTGADALLPKRQARAEVLSLVKGVVGGFRSTWDGSERRRTRLKERRAVGDRRRQKSAGEALDDRGEPRYVFRARGADRDAATRPSRPSHWTSHGG